jgi:hypothetical protein
MLKRLQRLAVDVQAGLAGLPGTFHTVFVQAKRPIREMAKEVDHNAFRQALHRHVVALTREGHGQASAFAAGESLSVKPTYIGAVVQDHARHYLRGRLVVRAVEGDGADGVLRRLFAFAAPGLVLLDRRLVVIRDGEVLTSRAAR